MGMLIGTLFGTVGHSFFTAFAFLFSSLSVNFEMELYVLVLLVEFLYLKNKLTTSEHEVDKSSE